MIQLETPNTESPALVVETANVRLPKPLKALGVQRLRVEEGRVVGVHVPAGRRRSEFGLGWRTGGRRAPSLLLPCSEATCAMLAAIRLPEGVA